MYSASADQKQKEMQEAMAQSLKDQGIDANNLDPGKILMTPPVLSDEENGSQFMPRIHRCDGCKAVAYQVIVNLSFN